MKSTLMRTAELAALLDVHPDTLSHWGVTRPEFRAARWRRGWWKVGPLKAAGIIEDD